MFQYNPTSLDHYTVENFICARSDLNSIDPKKKQTKKMTRGKSHHHLNKPTPSQKINLGREYTTEYGYFIRNIP